MMKSHRKIIIFLRDFYNLFSEYEWAKKKTILKTDSLF